MSIFEYVTAALLIILGLGIAELLNDTIGLFRDRHERRPEWISLSWAGIIFAHQMQFLWAIFELNTLVQAWSAFSFIVALLLALLLFSAGALIIPRPSASGTWDPWHRFMQNGRWSLIALSTYNLIAFLANPLFFSVPMWSSLNVPNLVLAVYLAGTFFLRRRVLWAVSTAGYALFTAYEIVQVSPSTYS